MTCDDVVNNYLATLRDSFNCVQQDGRLCVVTPYLYPDHDNVEIFVRERIDGEIVVSDLGETLRHLDTLGMNFAESGSLIFTIKKIADGFGVEAKEGIILKSGKKDSLGQIVFDVISTCKAVGDLLYGGRAYQPRTFEEEVIEYFTSNDVGVEPNLPIKGVSGHPYTVSLRATGRKRRVLIDAIAVRAKRNVDATFRMWSDINSEFGTPEKKISLLDDDVKLKPSEESILSRVSQVVHWGDRSVLLDSL